MDVARALLLRASRSHWLAEQFRRRKFARRAVRRFMPGEGVGVALDASARFAADGIGSVFTNLGERVTSREEAAAVREHYAKLLGSIRERRLPAHISVKLTHLGLDIDAGGCAAAVLSLVERAADVGSFVWIDMEESQYVDATLDVFRLARARTERVGVCLQAYLRRTGSDLDALLPLAPAIRLVKGAYREPPEVAFPRKQDTDAAYVALGEQLLDRAGNGALPVFGTHDMRILERLRRRADARKLPTGAYEVHMLYGIKPAQQRALASRRVAVRVLISYGSNWFPWYMRRLAERPANAWFVVKSLLG